VAELRPRAGAVDPRRVVELARDPAEASEVDDHSAADPPDPEQDEARIDPGRILEPVRRVGDADQAEELVDPAAVDVEHRLPDEDARHERHDVGHEEEDAEQARHPQVAAVEEERDRERQDDRDRKREGGELERDAERIPRAPIGEHRPVVVEPDEPQRLLLVEVDVREREDERRDHRQEREREEADDPR